MPATTRRKWADHRFPSRRSRVRPPSFAFWKSPQIGRFCAGSGALTEPRGVLYSSFVQQPPGTHDRQLSPSASELCCLFREVRRPLRVARLFETYCRILEPRGAFCELAQVSVTFRLAIEIVLVPRTPSEWHQVSLVDRFIIDQTACVLKSASALTIALPVMLRNADQLVSAKEKPDLGQPDRTDSLRSKPDSRKYVPAFRRVLGLRPHILVRARLPATVAIRASWGRTLMPQ
jgi:hypothetical protein